MAKKSSPVSVIIPCYRCHTMIERAFYSVLSQTVSPEEIILVEDCSNDEGKTLSVLNRLKEECNEKISVKILMQKSNQGPSAARNIGWKAAQMPYIAFLDADDAWDPRKIEIQYEWMSQHPDVTLSCHRSARLFGDQFTSESVALSKCIPIKGWKLLLSDIIATRSVMIKRDIPFRFPEDKRYTEDYFLWLQIILKGYKAWYLDAVLCYSYDSKEGNNNLSSHLWKMEMGELDTYKRLYNDKLLPFCSLFVLFPWSLFKYIRRVFMRFLGL